MKLTKKQKKNLLIAAGAAGAGLFLYNQYTKAKYISFSPKGISNFNISIVQNKLSFILKLGLTNTTNINVKLKGLKGNIYVQNALTGSFNLVQDVTLKKQEETVLNIGLNLPIDTLITSLAELSSAYMQGKPLGIEIQYSADTNIGTFNDVYKF